MTPKFVPDDQLDEWFGYHPPSDASIALAHEMVRARCRDLARFLSDLLPECPDKTVALRAVRQVMYEANATIACQQKLYDCEAAAPDLALTLEVTAEAEVIKASEQKGDGS